MIKRTQRNGTPLAPTVRDRLRVLVDDIGEYETAKIVGVGYASIARAIAGLGLRRGTAIAIEMRLDALKTKTTPQPARAKR